MKAGLVIYGGLENLSGGFLYDRLLVDFLRRQGDSVEIISQPWSPYPNLLGQNFQSAMIRRLQSLEVDVLLQDELNHPSLFQVNAILRTRVSYPIISIVHHLRSSEQYPRLLNGLYRAIEYRYLSSVDAFIWNSQTTRRVVEGLLRRQTNGVVAYPAGDRLGGMQEDDITRRCQEPGPLRLLFIGSLIPRKGLHTLISALAALKMDSWTLAVIGRQDVDPDYSRQVRQMVHTYHLEGHIQFLGNLPEAELAAQLRQGQVLVMVSSYEGFGIVYLEGMSFGLPAIASTTGASGEIIQSGENGWLVDAGDVAGLAESIAKYQQSSELLLAHSLAARRRFQQFPTWEDSALKIRRFVSDFVENEWKGRK